VSTLFDFQFEESK
jgi:Zinc finger C-x8-C-x5-C-x3-H type (and similar)